MSKGKAEGGGGFGGNSAFPLLNQNEASPATLQFIARHHRKILFSLEEKEIRRAQNEKSKEYFSVVWRACRAVAGLASLVWFRSAVFDKIGSSQTVKTHQFYSIMKIVICGSMTASKGMVEVEKKLKESGYEIVLPEFTHEYAAMDMIDKMHTESARNKSAIETR